MKSADNTSKKESDLAYLNARYHFPLRSVEATKEPASGLFGRIKQRVIARLRAALFADFSREQTEFQQHLVRVLNELDERLKQYNWRAEDFLEASRDTLERSSESKLAQEVRPLRAAANQLEHQQGQAAQRLDSLEQLVGGLEQAIALLPRRNEPPIAADQAQVEYPDLRYLMLENRYRGSETEIRTRLSPYTEVFRDVTLPVIEIGSGRGELQELFTAEDIPSYGLEIDSGMLALCKLKELDVRESDVLTHLRGLEPNTLGGAIAIQLVEHLDHSELEELLSLLASRVVAGGRVVLETINTKSILALAHNYFRDPTHAQPLHPETLQYLCELSGLKVNEMRELSKFPDEACLLPLAMDSALTPRWQVLLERYNHNVTLLNSLLFGAQDYCLIAEVS